MSGNSEMSDCTRTLERLDCILDWTLELRAHLVQCHTLFKRHAAGSFIE